MPTDDVLRILLVENEEDHAILFQDLLDDCTDSFQTICKWVKSLSEADQELQSATYDLVALDLGLNETKGIETLRAMMALQYDIPIIVLTAQQDAVTGQEAIHMGAQDYLVKGQTTAAMLCRAATYSIERKKQLNQLEQMNEDLEAFARAASHDLMSPLGNIANLTVYLQEEIGEENLNDEAKYLFGMIQGATERARTLVKDLLKFFRTTGQEINSKLFLLEEAVNAATQNLQTLIETRDAVIEVEELPQIYGDKSLLTQVFQNLMANGIKYVRDYPPQLRVTSTLVGLQYEIRVIDNGIGVPEGQEQHIFQPLRRAVKESEFSGSGIGLTICKRIVESHGGTIWVEPNPDKGSIFVMSLPVANSEPDA